MLQPLATGRGVEELTVWLYFPCIIKKQKLFEVLVLVRLGGVAHLVECNLPSMHEALGPVLSSP